MTDNTQSISTEGGSAAEQAQDKAREVTSQAQDKATEVASQAQDRAREAAGQARGRVREQVDQRSTQLGEQVSSTASDARSVAEELRNQGKQTPARYVEQAAERAERLGGYLEESDGDRLLNDVEDFARRNTWAVVVGGLALGFAASRLLKASSADRYRKTRSSDGGELTRSSFQSPGATGSLTRESAATGDVASPGIAGEPASPGLVSGTGGASDALTGTPGGSVRTGRIQPESRESR